MDQLKAMQIFRAVADCRSFAQAAEQLALPRPTVTNAVQSVERQLGVRLLQRTTRKVSLTVEGALYLERCTRLLGELDEMNALFHGVGVRPSGSVRVDLPERMAHHILIPKLAQFFALYPDIHVKIGSHDRFVDLVGEGIDCAVRVGTLRDSTLVARRIGAMAQINVAAPAYLARHGTPRHPSELGEHYAVNYLSSQTGRELDWEYSEAGQARSIRMRSLVSVSSTEAYQASCLAGLGLIQAPRMGMEAPLTAGTLVEVLPDWRPPPLPVSLVHAHGRQPSPRVRVFVDWLLGALEIR